MEEEYRYAGKPEMDLTVKLYRIIYTEADEGILLDHYGPLCEFAGAPAALSTVLNQLWPPYGTYPHEKRLAWALKFTRATHPDSARIFTTLLEPEGIQPAIFRTEPDAKITDLSILPNIAGCFGYAFPKPTWTMQEDGSLSLEKPSRMAQT